MCGWGGGWGGRLTRKLYNATQHMQRFAFHLISRDVSFSAARRRLRIAAPAGCSLLALPSLVVREEGPQTGLCWVICAALRQPVGAPVWRKGANQTQVGLGPSAGASRGSSGDEGANMDLAVQASVGATWGEALRGGTDLMQRVSRLGTQVRLTLRQMAPSGPMSLWLTGRRRRAGEWVGEKGRPRLGRERGF